MSRLRSLVAAASASSQEKPPVAPAGADLPVGNEPLQLRDSIRARRRDGHGQVVTALAYTPDSKVLAAAGLDGKVRLWNAEATKVLRTLATFLAGGLCPRHFAGWEVFGFGRIVV